VICALEVVLRLQMADLLNPRPFLDFLPSLEGMESRDHGRIWLNAGSETGGLKEPAGARL
jgi:hypothetical protein